MTELMKKASKLEQEEARSQVNSKGFDKIDGIGLGLTFIWASIVLLLDVVGNVSNIAWWDGWGLFFIGAGIISLILSAIRLQIPEYRAKWIGGMILSGILLAIGLGTWHNLGWLWLVLPMVIGMLILKSALYSSNSK